MSKNDIRSFFSGPGPLGTNSSVPVSKKRLRSVNAVAEARSARLKKQTSAVIDLETFADDDDGGDDIRSVNSGEIRKSGSDFGADDDERSDDAAIVIGSLAQEMSATPLQSSKSKTTTTTTTLTKSTSTKTNRTLSANTSTTSAVKNDSPNQLFSIGVSLPRRSGSAAADSRMPTERSRTAEWTPVREMCRFMEIDGNFTGVDVGRVNLGIVQISCSGEKIKILDWKLVNLDTLCSEFEQANRQERFAETTKKYRNEDHVHCLAKWVEKQTKVGGIFDSAVVFIEQQAFTREMKAIQTTIHSAVILNKPAVIVCLNMPELGREGIREANYVACAQLVAANSVKTCYSAYFPRVTATAAATRALNPYKKRKPFGHADAFRSKGDADEDINNQRQYAENKRNSAHYGQKLIAVDEIIRLLHGTKMDDAQMKRFREEKKDDIYDALWLVLYGIETWLPAVYATRKRGYAAKSLMYAPQPQRRYRTYDALFEFARSVGTSEQNIAEMRAVMMRFKGVDADDDDAVEE